MKRLNLALLDTDSNQRVEATVRDPAPLLSSKKKSSPVYLAPLLVHILQEVQREIGISNGGSTESAPSYSESELEKLIVEAALKNGCELTSLEKHEIINNLLAR